MVSPPFRFFTFAILEFGPDTVHLPSIARDEIRAATSCEDGDTVAIFPFGICAQGQALSSIGKDFHNAAVHKDAQAQWFTLFQIERPYLRCARKDVAA